MMLPVYSVRGDSSLGVDSVATLFIANVEDMPLNWRCNWLNLWDSSDFDCQAIIKMSYKQKLVGLLKLSLYPPLSDSSLAPHFLEINNIEALSHREFNPVGFWLIWYACNIALLTCTAADDESLVILDSLEEAMTYYRDKVMMEFQGLTTIAPGEDGYAFSFTRQGATDFCRRIESRYGKPK
jgi:hypothetical protein